MVYDPIINTKIQSFNQSHASKCPILDRSPNVHIGKYRVPNVSVTSALFEHFRRSCLNHRVQSTSIALITVYLPFF